MNDKVLRFNNGDKIRLIHVPNPAFKHRLNKTGAIYKKGPFPAGTIFIDEKTREHIYPIDVDYLILLDEDQGVIGPALDEFLEAI